MVIWEEAEDYYFLEEGGEFADYGRKVDLAALEPFGAEQVASGLGSPSTGTSRRTAWASRT